MSPGAAPAMAVPHLDTRIINGKKALLFGPYAAWTTKFLHKGGSYFDLRIGALDNIASLIKVGLHNIPLVQYLIQQGTQSMNTRMGELRNFYPDANEDWELIDAGIRVQVIKVMATPVSSISAPRCCPARIAPSRHCWAHRRARRYREHHSGDRPRMFQPPAETDEALV